MENRSQEMKQISVVMKIKELLRAVKNVSYNDIVLYMYQPTDSASLGIIRFMFGFLMLIDIPEERAGADIDVRWGDPEECHFPLFGFLEPISFPYMGLLYCIMWFGALGIMLGYKFQLSTFLFGLPYWYVFLLDKSHWNNHSYLFGLVAILMMGTSANHYFSLDGYLDHNKRNRHVPYWNYFILKFQFFILYFFAGLKKTDKEWLEGYSMSDLGQHWVFLPFQLFLSSEKIDYFVVHWFGFLLDLTIGFWMLLELTRPVAMVFCLLFHLMNSRLFSIGMFPYVCIATMPLFCEENWPKKLLKFFTGVQPEKPLPSASCIYRDLDTSTYKEEKSNKNVKRKHKFVVALLIGHIGLQIFLPYSHFITKGYNNWTNGLYGYSWDMMVHSWDTIMVVIKVVDNETGKEHFVDPTAYTQNDRWNKHADMCVQYAQCLKRNIKRKSLDGPRKTEEADLSKHFMRSENLSIYIDVWCSLNKRFQQRMFDPNYDLLKANWSPFESIEWLMPVLSEYNNLRTTMNNIMQEVYSWSNVSDALFIADFPGLTLENYIQKDLSNVTLTVLEGEIAYEIEDEHFMQSVGVKLKKGDSISIEVGVFHKIHTLSSTPSCYLYTFAKEKEADKEESLEPHKKLSFSFYSIFEAMQIRVIGVLRMWKHFIHSIRYILFDIPYHIRSGVIKE